MNVAAVLTGCVVVATLVTTSVATVDSSIGTYWLLYLVLVMAVASEGLPRPAHPIAGGWGGGRGELIVSRTQPEARTT